MRGKAEYRTGISLTVSENLLSDILDALKEDEIPVLAQRRENGGDSSEKILRVAPDDYDRALKLIQKGFDPEAKQEGPQQLKLFNPLF